MSIETAPLLRSGAEVATPNASRYLQQLCKHFAHKRPVEFTPETGSIAFTGGECQLAAKDGVLAMSVTASGAEDLSLLQDVVARHLERFAFREPLAIEWSGPQA